MYFDLQGEDGMTPVVGMLYSAVRENSRRMQSITDGMSQVEVDYRGLHDKFNSTAQLIKHITYVDLNWVYRIMRQPLPASLIEQYGPMIDANNKLPMVKGVPLSTLNSNYEVVLDRLREACKQVTDADLERVVTFGHENEKKATLRWGLWHMADHSRYHQAQVNQLRRWYREKLKLNV
ncbi:DinB family protein [Paenibacillus hexagrammi]|uniref:DinB family protein n=1 Tax=Paenibacillus hexagrammi TaxID=2908839 RepID=A0ABY3SFY4_9BACL|nr:DinB family protein [Paenibacillus sp. YPD9-1]UJF32370.1 DinB family protein [Paenibacillus sp. YPD9-1]